MFLYYKIQTTPCYKTPNTISVKLPDTILSFTPHYTVPQHSSNHRQRRYRQIVRKYLWFFMNLHDPNSEPPCMEEWRWRLVEFSQIPLPKTEEEKAAIKEADILARRKRVEEERIKRIEAIKAAAKAAKAPPEPTPFRFQWQKYFWANNRGGLTTKGGQACTLATSTILHRAISTTHAHTRVYKYVQKQ